MEEFNPGAVPVGPRVLVWPIPAEEKSDGGIIIAQQTREREDMAQVRAIVVALGFEAFQDCVANWTKRGDTVLIAKYAGLYHTGPDGKQYRVINDTDIVARIEDTPNE